MTYELLERKHNTINFNIYNLYKTMYIICLTFYYLKEPRVKFSALTNNVTVNNNEKHTFFFFLDITVVYEQLGI